MRINELEQKFVDSIQQHASLSPFEVENLMLMHQRELLEWKSKARVVLTDANYLSSF